MPCSLAGGTVCLPTELVPSVYHGQRHTASADRTSADPGKYAPQYGGYCAKAVSENTTADIDPEAWKIVDGKLYLNYSEKIQKLWEEDMPGRISRADANWSKLVGK